MTDYSNHRRVKIDDPLDEDYVSPELEELIKQSDAYRKKAERRGLWRELFLSLCEPQKHELARGIPVGVSILLLIFCFIVT